MVLKCIEVNRFESRVHLLRKLLSSSYTPYTVEFYLNQLDESSFETFENSLVFDSDGDLILVDPNVGNKYNHEKYDYRAYFKSLVSDENNQLEDELFDYYVSDYYYLYQQGVEVDEVSVLKEFNYYIGRVGIVINVLRKTYNDDQIKTILSMYGISTVDYNICPYELGQFYTHLKYLEEDIDDLNHPEDFKGALFEDSLINLERLSQFDDFESYVDYYATYDLGFFIDSDEDLIEAMNEMSNGDYGVVTKDNLKKIMYAVKQSLINNGPLGESKDGTIFYFWVNEEDADVFDYKEYVYSISDLNKDNSTDEAIEEQVHLYAYKQRELVSQLTEV